MKKFLVATTVITLLGVGVTLHARHSYRFCHSQGSHHFGHSRFFRLLGELDLSDAQKNEIAQVFKANKPDISPLIDDLVQTRRDLFDLIHAEEVEEDRIRTASAKLAQIQEGIALLKAKAFHEFRQVLTTQQLGRIEALKSEIESTTDQRIEFAWNWFDRWIEKHSTDN